MSLAAKNCCTDKAVCNSALSSWMNQSWFSHYSRSFWQSWSLRHCKTSQLLVSHLAWRQTFLMKSAFIVKKDHQHALDIRLDLPHFLQTWRGWAFALRGLLFGFWIVTVNPGFYLREEVLVISDLIQQFMANTRHCFCSSVSNRGTNFTDIHDMYKSSIRICWHVPYERRNLTALPEIVPRSSSLMIWHTFSMFSSVWPVVGRPECEQSSTTVFLGLNRENHSKVCGLPTALWPNAVMSIWCISNVVLSGLWSKTYCKCVLPSAIRKFQIAISTHNNRHPSKSNTEGYGGKTH
jgi:hypothetical protein